MRPLAIMDARDGFAHPLRGWGRYARCLSEAITRLPLGERSDFRVGVIRRGGRGPEVFFEQVKLPILLRRQGADVVHATDCFLPLLRPCPGVVTIHDLAFEDLTTDMPARTRLKYRTLARGAARSAQRVICPSGFTRDDVCTRYGVDPAKVRVIPEAPALPMPAPTAGPARAAASPPMDGPYILAVGDLRPKKNLPALVSALAELHRRGATRHRLVLAGLDAGEGDRLRELAGSAPLEMTGYVSDARLDALLRGAELVVHPSLFEGFGLVVLEAMVRGTPVLAARAGALPETGGEAAAYFDPADPDSLTRELGRLLSDPGARASLAEAGEVWSAGFSWEEAARRTAAVYRELVP